jgi:hypothetical protein
MAIIIRSMVHQAAKEAPLPHPAHGLRHHHPRPQSYQHLQIQPPNVVGFLLEPPLDSLTMSISMFKNVTSKEQPLTCPRKAGFVHDDPGNSKKKAISGSSFL